MECLLLHPHAWVRLAACRLFGLLFAAHQPHDLVPGTAEAAAIKKRERKRGRRSAGSVADVTEYLLKDSIKKVNMEEGGHRGFKPPTIVFKPPSTIAPSPPQYSSRMRQQVNHFRYYACESIALNSWHARLGYIYL